MAVAEHDQIPEAALEWARAGKGAALATVVETWGSAPRPAGSQLAISGAAELAGSVSGGCVEGAVVVEALEALEDGRPRMLEYGVSDAEAFAVGLACGGRIYPAKDARMSAAAFQASFPDWRELARHVDPALSSSFWRRVTAEPSSC